MICVGCQHVIPDVSKFCSYCGTALAPSPVPVPPPPAPPTPVAASPPPLPPQAAPSSAGSSRGIGSYVAAHKILTFGAAALAALAALGLFAVVLFLAGIGGDEPPPSLPASADTQPLPSDVNPPSPVPAAAALCTSPSPADVMENALPSIVQILTDSGSGSGFIVNDGGLVVTNQHVVEGSRNIRVRLGTGRITYPGEVVERDPRLDLAYVQIDSRLEFTPIAIGDSDEIRVGEEVIAIGFPLGSELGDDATITTGVILAKREDLDFLQTDASLNPRKQRRPAVKRLRIRCGSEYCRNRRKRRKNNLWHQLRHSDQRN